MNQKEMENMAKQEIAEVLSIAIEEVDENESFYRLGVSSVQALKVVNRIRKKLNIDLNPVAMFEYKCIAQLSEYLIEVIQEQAE